MEERPPYFVVPDPVDPEYVWMTWCPMCGLAPYEHTEEACAERLAAWKPLGILSALRGTTTEE